MICTLIACLYSVAVAATPPPIKEPVLKTDGCSLLYAPATFNGQLVSIEGVAYGAFESFSISFDCAGYINLKQSLSENDRRKFGFRTIDDAQMKKLNKALFPNPLFTRHGEVVSMNGERHTAKVQLVGRFQCHQDFPDCSSISAYGDSSVVIRSILSVSEINKSEDDASIRRNNDR
jgi:hypothetical protein